MSKIALVVLDTLRKDAFDNHFDWLPGARFDRAWSTSHATVPSHASLFTGLYPSETGVYGTGEMFDFPSQSLAELLSESGIQSDGFSCNPFISDTFGFTRGFESM
jgi:arylsulfatase A-like enzyme